MVDSDIYSRKSVPVHFVNGIWSMLPYYSQRIIWLQMYYKTDRICTINRKISGQFLIFRLRLMTDSFRTSNTFYVCCWKLANCVYETSKAKYCGFLAAIITHKTWKYSQQCIRVIIRRIIFAITVNVFPYGWQYSQYYCTQSLSPTPRSDYVFAHVEVWRQPAA